MKKGRECVSDYVAEYGWLDEMELGESDERDWRVREFDGGVDYV